MCVSIACDLSIPSVKVLEIFNKRKAVLQIEGPRSESFVALPDIGIRDLLGLDADTANDREVHKILPYYSALRAVQIVWKLFE